MAHYPEQPPSSESRSRGLLIVSDDVSVGRNAQLLDVVVEAVQVGKIARNVLGRLDAVVQVEVRCGRNVRPEGRKEGNVLFNDALNAFLFMVLWRCLFNDVLNTFYLQLYGVGHMVKDHSDSERGNLLLPHGLLFPISSKVFFICTIPTDRIAYTMAFVTSVV